MKQIININIICIHNIDVNKGMNHSASYEKDKNKREYISNRHSLKGYYKKNNIEKNQKNDKNDFKIINAQNIKVKEDQKIFRNLVPITMNKIEYSLNLKNSGSAIKTNNKDIYEIRKINKNNENFNERYNNIKNHTIIQTNLKKLKKPNWNQINKEIKQNNIIFENNNKIDNKEQIIPIKYKEKNELNTEKLEINIIDNKNKYNEELSIEKASIDLEEKEEEKDNNSNLLLSSSQKNKIKTNYPKKICNNIAKPINENQFTFKDKSTNLLMKKNVEKIIIKSNKSNKDRNILNHDKKEVDINIYEKKERDNLLKDKNQQLIKKDTENCLNKKKDKNSINKKVFHKNFKNNENEEEILFNDDYNIIEKNYMRPVKANIKQIKRISHETKRLFDDYNKNINKSINSYEEKDENKNINKISEKTHKGNEIIKRKIDRKENNDYNLEPMKNKMYFESIHYTSQNLYLKKKINLHSTFLKKHKKSQNNIKKEKAPSIQYIYREIITNIKSEIENQKENQKDIKKLELIKKNNNKENNTSEISSPKSRTKYCYREQIITLSPNSSENQENLFTATFSNKNLIKNSDINKKNDCILKINSKISLNRTKNKNKNLKEIINKVPKDENNSKIKKEYYNLEKSEIPNIQGQESELTNNNIYIEDISQKSPTKIKSIQYIYNKGNSKKNLPKSHFKQLINQQKSERNNNYYIKEIPKLKKEKLQNNIQVHEKEKIKEENMNRKYEDIFIHNSAIINKDYLNNIKIINSLNKTNNLLQKIELSKSQENQLSSTDSQ